jgi:transposase
LIAAERDELVRAAWRAGMAGIDPARFVFLDETSTPLSLTPLRARAPRGQRAVGRVPHGKRPHLSWLATLTREGIGESVGVPGAVDGQVFDLFVARWLVPSLRPGQIVLLDNLKVHDSAMARRLIAAAGCHLVFLPTYSPDFNPIEQAFAKVKQALRRSGARSWEAIVTAIGAALETVSTADARAFFADAGFPLP